MDRHVRMFVNALARMSIGFVIGWAFFTLTLTPLTSALLIALMLVDYCTVPLPAPPAPPVSESELAAENSTLKHKLSLQQLTIQTLEQNLATAIATAESLQWMATERASEAKRIATIITGTERDRIRQREA